MQKMSSAEKAVEVIRSGDRVFVHGGAAVPHALLKGLFSRAERLQDVELIHLHLEGELPYGDERIKLMWRGGFR